MSTATVSPGHFTRSRLTQSVAAGRAEAARQAEAERAKAEAEAAAREREREAAAAQARAEQEEENRLYPYVREKQQTERWAQPDTEGEHRTGS